MKSPLREAALIGALLLAGCSSENDTGWQQIYEAGQMMFAGDAGTITLKQAASVPYASMGVRVGGGPEQMVVLASGGGAGQLWTSAAHIAIETRGGRIIRTSGFEYNLSAVAGGDPLAAFADPNAPAREDTRQADFRDMNLFAVTLHCHIESKGADPVTILGAVIKTHRIEEICKSEKPDWSFTNIFWMDASGLVWKSVQHIHPDLDPLTTEILRPPAD